jgi:hypothetical protein
MVRLAKLPTPCAIAAHEGREEPKGSGDYLPMIFRQRRQAEHRPRFWESQNAGQVGGLV